MNILENAKKHFKDRRELRGPILVPEWGDDDKPAEIYYQVPNMKERSEVFKYVNEGGLEGVILTLILIAKDANGEPIFKRAQKAELMQSVDPDVVNNIVSEMDLTGTGEDLGN